MCCCCCCCFYLKVNYVKTIDKYLIGCFLFVFSTLVEYAVVLFLDAGRKRRLRNGNEKKKKKKQNKKRQGDSLLDVQYCSSTAYSDNYQVKRQNIIICLITCVNIPKLLICGKESQGPLVSGCKGFFRGPANNIFIFARLI